VEERREAIAIMTLIASSPSAWKALFRRRCELFGFQAAFDARRYNAGDLQKQLAFVLLLRGSLRFYAALKKRHAYRSPFPCWLVEPQIATVRVSQTSAVGRAAARQPRKLSGLEARGVEPLSSSLSTQTSTCLSGVPVLRSRLLRRHTAGSRASAKSIHRIGAGRSADWPACCPRFRR
jgi:hypothetical protein